MEQIWLGVTHLQQLVANAKSRSMLLFQWLCLFETASQGVT